MTDAGGLFQADVTMMTPNAEVRLVYSGDITSDIRRSMPGPSRTSPANVSTPLQVMDEGHQTRSDSQSVMGVVVVYTLRSFWHGAVRIHRLRALADRSQSAGGLSRADAGIASTEEASAQAVGGRRGRNRRHTDLDYIPVPTDFMTSTERPFVGSRECTLFHEFGHDIWFTLDGDEQHWRNDLMSYGYARSHSGNDLTNVHYAWSEGWADYWSGANQKSGSEKTASQLPS